jgi:hypothetical protein
MDESMSRHCAELNRCNQRGGRMLSIFDLLDAGTLDLDLAAYLVGRISRGASFMVGARPGGLGKTTVMCALLNFVPDDVEIVAATSEAVRHAAGDSTLPRSCYVCHEVGSGPYFAYLWDADLRAYCSLARIGHVLATNLHADDMEDAKQQVCVENGVSIADFNAFHLLIFLRMDRGLRTARRRIDKVYASDGVSPHTLVFDASKRTNRLPDDSWVTRCRVFLDETLQTGVRTIEQTRERVVAFLGGP